MKFAEGLPISNPAIPHVGIIFSVYTPPRTNMTGWKIPMFNRKYVFKWWIFQPVTFFLGGSLCKSRSLGTRTSDSLIIDIIAVASAHLLWVLVFGILAKVRKRGSIGDEIPL